MRFVWVCKRIYSLWLWSTSPSQSTCHILCPFFPSNVFRTDTRVACVKRRRRHRRRREEMSIDRVWRAHNIYSYTECSVYESIWCENFFKLNDARLFGFCTISDLKLRHDTEQRSIRNIRKQKTERNHFQLWNNDDAERRWQWDEWERIIRWKIVGKQITVESFLICMDFDVVML